MVKSAISFCADSFIQLTAWKEVGEKSMLAIFFSNEYLLLRSSIHGCRPIVKQIQWYPGKNILAMNWDPSGAWLIATTLADGFFIIPAVALLEPESSVDQKWKIGKVSPLKHSMIGIGLNIKYISM